MSDYKPSPFHKSPFSVGMAILILAIFGAFAWAEWGSALNRQPPAATSAGSPTPSPAKQPGGTQP